MAQQQQHQHEFLPLCDVLFNIISLASYFCDVVFDLTMGYALAYNPSVPSAMFPLSLTFVIVSLIISQVVSLRWYLWGARGKLTNNMIDTNLLQEKKTCSWTIGFVLFFHSTQVGVLWRYFKLFIPVDLAYVKHEVRELCVLRLIHAFCEAAPMLLLQLYLLSIGMDRFDQTDFSHKASGENKLSKLTAISAGLSLWSICWAVASFSKGAARLRNLERLVLTWLGVLAQLGWRLGTVSARVGALIAYATLYGGQWLIVVMALHWLSMLTWLLLTPDGLFHGGEKLPFSRKAFLASLLAFVYIFAYVNLHETNHRQKMIIFYTVMFLENSLLIGIWAAGNNRNDLFSLQLHTHPATLILTLLSLFFGGLCFMGLYYRFFHVRRLMYEAGGRMNGTNITTLSNQDHSDSKHQNGIGDKKMNMDIGIRKVKISNGGIPGVFNCRFANPTATNPNRKKKKPTSFVPPPVQHQMNCLPVSMNGESKQLLNGSMGTKQLIPFWKRPLEKPIEETVEKSELDLGIGGSFNVNLIHEKLREKKQQQLRELRAIQEEIKEGKLVPPPSASTSTSPVSPVVSNQQPPPNTKLHTSPTTLLSVPMSEQNGDATLSPWPPVKMYCLLQQSLSSSPHHHHASHPNNVWKTPQKDRSDTPEILLTPRGLPLNYPHWTPLSHTNHRLRTSQNEDDDCSKVDGEGAGEISDMEGSQVSLPRSYTLPREFKYNTANNDLREHRSSNSKLQSSRYYLPSTNSSDGDVDSADNEEETDSELHLPSKLEHIHELKKNNLASRNYLFVNKNVSIPAETLRVNDNLSNGLPSTLGLLRSNQMFRSKVKHETKL